MSKHFLAGFTVLLVLGAVLVVGCTSPTTTSPTPSAATSTVGTHDAFLDQYVAKLESELRNNTTVSSWVAKWQNGSSVGIQVTFKNVTSNRDVNLNRSVIRFASTDDATNYVNSNNAGYQETTNVTKLVSLPYKAYETTRGSAPTVYSAWTKVVIRDLSVDTIQQLDNTVVADSQSVSSS
jgi:hypothetical protein